MPKTDPDPLGNALQSRLRAELDRIRPRYSSPRYLTAHRVGAWRLAPAGLAAGVAGMLVLTAYAATGSANPVVWSQRIVTVVEPASTPQASPTSAPGSPAPSQEPKEALPPSERDATPGAEPSERPEASPTAEPPESPEPSQSPEPSGGGGDDRGTALPSPDPESGYH